MALSKLVLKFFFSSSLLVILSSVALAENSNVFTEYIGAERNGVNFTDVPINSKVQFTFMLAYAVDYIYPNTSDHTNGKFQITWQDHVLTPEAVASIKAKNPNVKVGLSLGTSFSAESVQLWADNALISLLPIIDKYHIDGIDINYDEFKNNDTIFTECIGKLITNLKNVHDSETSTLFVSIAPSPNTQTHYKNLYAKHSDLIDYVNFQFYNYSADTKVEEFLEYYNEQLRTYGGDKLLASFTTDNRGGGLKPPGFFDACKILLDDDKLLGIVVWSADYSQVSNTLFEYEKKAQQLLADHKEANHLKLLSNA